MIQFIGVTKIYPNKYRALENINLEIAEGEFIFLIGPSGSGKTTIIRQLIREEKPTDGRIYFDNEEITNYKRKHVYALRRKIGVVFQDYKLIQDKNAYENIAFAMEAAGKNPKDIEETVPYVLDIVGLLNRANAFPEQLSGGEKQRVAIARAISNNPKLLIADEPTGNLDPDAAWDIVQILAKINNWGTTVIMATHGSEIVDALGKRVVTLDQGKITQDILNGSYKSVEVAIEKEKRRKEKKPKPEPEKKQEKQKKKKQKEKKKATKKIDTKKAQDLPPVSLTDRRKAKKVGNEEFEEMVKESLAPEKKKKKQKEKKPEKITAKTDLKDLNLGPKLTSILKAFGYKDIKSLKNAGYKKVSKIDELSTKDLKKIKELINKKL